MLLEGKKTFKHGQWMNALKKLPFNIDTAEQLMKIARSKVLSNSENFRNLPPSVSTLCELSKIPEEELEIAIKKGQVHAGMRRKDVDELDRFASLDFANAMLRLSSTMPIKEIEPEAMAGLMSACSLKSSGKLVFDEPDPLRYYALGDYIKDVALALAEKSSSRMYGGPPAEAFEAYVRKMKERRRKRNATLEAQGQPKKVIERIRLNEGGAPPISSVMRHASKTQH
jgi:hypothetical protein